jgi:microcystin-dependent protein
MAHTTPIYALPYPDETDTADVPRDVQALANRIEAVLPGVGIKTGMGCDWYSAAAPPAGFFACDGSAVSRTTYAALFAALGTTWGVGDGTTTFNLPDTRGRVIVGLGTHADVATVGLTEGSPLANRRPRHPHTNGLALTGAPGVGSLQLPDHAHSVSDPGHFHSFVSYDSGGPANVPQSASPQNPSGSDRSGAFGSAAGPIVSATTGLGVAGVTSHPAIGGAPTIGTLAVGGTVGAAGVAVDAPAYVVCSKVVKT